MAFVVQNRKASFMYPFVCLFAGYQLTFAQTSLPKQPKNTPLTINGTAAPGKTAAPGMPINNATSSSTNGVLSSWPSGTYSLPKASSGCPELWSDGWIKQDMDDKNTSKSSFSPGIHMEAVLTNDYIKRSFCTKTTTYGKNTSWPAGSYCIYKNLACPVHMNSGYITWDDEDSVNKNDKHGVLPDGLYSFTHHVITRIYYCCQDQGLWFNSIELPVDQPFYLLPHNSSNCQRVKWALSTLEYIVYDTEDELNADFFSPPHVYTDRAKSLPKVYYCYYEGCQHTLDSDSGNFNITDFPDFQYCSWKVIVQEGFVVLLNFAYVNVPHCDKNSVEIYDGENDFAPLLTRYCDVNSTSGNQLRGSGKTVLVVLKSGNNSANPVQNFGFRAEYLAVPASSGRCPAERTGENVTQGIFFWTAQDGKNVSFADCPYGTVSQNKHIKAQRTCECLSSSERNCEEVAWGEPVTTMCKYKVFNDSAVTQGLSNLLQSLKSNQSTPLKGSQELAKLTTRSEKLQPAAVSLTVLALENLAKIKENLNETGPNIVRTVNNILNVSRDVLIQSHRDSNSSSRILSILDEYLENVPLPKGGNVTWKEPNIALHAQQVNASDFQGAGVASLSKERENFRTYDDPANVQPQVSQVSLTIPKSIFKKLNIDSKTQNQRISFVVYRKTPLFESSNKSLPNNGYVIAGSIKGQKLENLTDPVVSTYIPLANAANESAACVFWDFARNGGLGGWSEIGCSYQGTKNGVVTCHCNHMTNFAILMDLFIGDRNKGEHQEALSIISYIGCAVSLTGLILTIITVLIFKDLRSKVPNQILLNFCIALSLTLTVFLAAAERSKTSSVLSCRAAAIALHYFVLAAFMWMAIEAFNMYLAFVKVLPKHYSHFILKCCIAGWGLPAIVVIITAAVASDKYGDATICRIQGLPFQVAFLAPVLLILVANSIAFVLIMRSLLTSRSRLAADRRVSGLRQARRGAAILVVLGLTWMFGVLAVKEAKLVFQYLFCIFDSIQGLLIFIFYCALSETRSKYKKLFGGKGGKDLETRQLRYKASTADWEFHEVHPKNTHDNTYTKSTNLSSDSMGKVNNSYDVDCTEFKYA